MSDKNKKPELPKPVRIPLKEQNKRGLEDNKKPSAPQPKPKEDPKKDSK